MSGKILLIYWVAMIVYARLKLIYLKAQLALPYSEEAKRAIREKVNQLNMTAGRF
jgi:hypothetical protein